jgi:hypothetical protein
MYRNTQLILTDTIGNQFIFFDFNGPPTLAGKLQGVTDPAGNATIFQYGPDFQEGPASMLGDLTIPYSSNTTTPPPTAGAGGTHTVKKMLLASSSINLFRRQISQFPVVSAPMAGGRDPSVIC